MRRSTFAFRTFALLGLATLVATAASAGLVFKQVARTEGGQGGFNQTTRVSLDTGGAKVEFLDSNNPLMPAGSYMLIRPDDDAMILVDPAKKTYASFDVGALMQSMSAMMNPAGGPGGEGMKPEASKPVIEKLLEEDGGTILGRKTKHFRYRMQWTMTMTLAPGMAMVMENDQLEDTWVADLQIDPKIARNFENMSAGMSLPKEFQELAAAQREMTKGLPLKRTTVTKTNVTGTGMMAAAAKMMAKDSSKPSTMTFEVVELAEEKVPASVFAIPAGYTETEMMSPGMKMPDMNRRN